MTRPAKTLLLRFSALAALALNACAPLTPAAVEPAASASPVVARDSLQAFALAGRFSLQHESKRYVGGLHWRHDDRCDQLLVSSPLGQGLAEIVSDSSGARLTGSDGSSQSAATADELLQALLAYPLPLRQLIDWLRGSVPDGGDMTRDALGRPLRLRHEAWRVDYEYDGDDAGALPGRVFVEREGGFTLRLRIDEWQTPPGENQACVP